MEVTAREVFVKTGTAIVVATVTSLEGEEINDYVNRLYAAWGVGRKGEDKGVLIFVAVRERKMRIETGYGVEGILPDGLVGEIRDRYIIPFFRRGEYGKGLQAGMTAIAAVVTKNAGVRLDDSPSGKAPLEKGERKGRIGLLSPWTVFLIVVVLALLLGGGRGRELLPWLFLWIWGGRGGGRYNGGGFDGFGGGFGGFGGGMSGGGGAGGDW